MASGIEPSPVPGPPGGSDTEPVGSSDGSSASAPTVSWTIDATQRGSDQPAPTLPRIGSEADTLGMTVHLSTRARFRVPGFEVREEIGRGGMGIVFRARQVNLDRDVALKVLPPAFASGPERLDRFSNEAAIAARLTHSRIVPIHDIVSADGVPVLVMPFVDGRDFARILADRKAVLRGESAEGRHPISGLDGREYLDRLLPLLDQVVEAVAEVHEADVLHRDIKPSNLLVDRRGHVQLTDFGLARLALESKLTAPGTGLGTPGYMAPEQWDGTPGIDRRADVFGLGATLYRALTLHLPFGKRRIAPTDGPPRRPSRLVPGLSKDFDAVLLKALEPDRKNRYADAVEFREDWRAVREGRVPKARRIGPVGLLARRAARHPWGVASAAAILLLALALGIVLMTTPQLPPPPDAERLVRVTTDPPGARFVVVALDEGTGAPDPGRIVQPEGGRRTAPSTDPTRPGSQDPGDAGLVRLKPGDYLVEVEWPDGRFHDVVRHVPGPADSPGSYQHSWWQYSLGAIELYPIHCPPPDVTEGMAHIAAQHGFAPRDVVGGSAAAPIDVPAFYLDVTEVTVEHFGRIGQDLPDRLRDLGPGPDEPVRFVDFDMAQHSAERLGKRLPCDLEFLVAATNGGQTRFPWGNDPGPLAKGSWTFGPAGFAQHDRTPGPTPVRGLLSNLAEWTMSRASSLASAPPELAGEDLIRAKRAMAGSVLPHFRIVLGGPTSVILGRPDPSELAEGLEARRSLPREQAAAGLGFRGARYASPRFLDAGRARP